MIPIVDIFAGPGGLGEGFSSYKDERGRSRFALAISMESDPQAHKTLMLRAFRRHFGNSAPSAYEGLLRGERTWEMLKLAYPVQAGLAEAEARQIELGPASVAEVRGLIDARVPTDKPWVLIGGPPCQAYSLVGRARNNGNAKYKPELDRRQTLYVEYLQILADHAPPVFVMENVKGLLSAKLNRQRLFDSIREDLRDPVGALRRENRSTRSKRPKYRIHAVVPTSDLQGDDPSGYVVRAEEFGIPQRRHRVILVGIREDASREAVSVLAPVRDQISVGDTIDDLPKVRSGLSKMRDSDEAWKAQMASVRTRRWMRSIDAKVRQRILHTLDDLAAPRKARGGEYLECPSGDAILNHATRAHIPRDLERYLFASAYGKVCKSSPTLDDFPKDLLPKHNNVEEALDHGLFNDRFRVQLAAQPATTITSHISKDGHYYIHHDPTQCRSLTVREAARLQTFPDDYFFCGPRTSQYHQVGNAVPPFLARQIAGIVAQLL
jgi:DNA (cytosine-5)-methyltransferase 1